MLLSKASFGYGNDTRSYRTKTCYAITLNRTYHCQFLFLFKRKELQPVLHTELNLSIEKKRKSKNQNHKIQLNGEKRGKVKITKKQESNKTNLISLIKNNKLFSK